MAHWAFEIADRLIAEKPDKEEYVCACGISPSGSVHIGNFRDVATSMFVARALALRGKKARLMLSWDDFDRLRKVPSNIASVVDGFEKNIGIPYTFIDDPFKTDVSYGMHFEHEFEKSIEEFGIKLDIRRQTEYYTSGKYTDQIILALEKRKQIYDILMSFKTQDASDEDRENYYPISVYCDECKKDLTKVVSFDEKTNELVYYCNNCGCEHRVNVRDYHLIKLSWKVDWPMRWVYEGVDFEPGGIDHATPNGSYDVAKVIVKEIFGGQAPLFQGYGWLGIQGLGSMHSSSGNNITPAKLLEIYEPIIIEWLFAKYRPEEAFEFAFNDTMIRHYSEFDKLIARANKGEINDFEKDLISLLFGDTKLVEKTGFGIISSVAPIVDFNIEALQKALAKAGVKFDSESFDRVEKVKNWIETYNPEKKYDLLQSANAEYYANLTDEEKDVIAKLYDYVANNDFTESEIQTYLYTIINDAALSKKENIERQKLHFKNIYNLLFGRNDGPRLYLFMAAANKDSYLNLLKF